jgi:xylulose-5-phosphate/fructose-6-phosphate phosphoketolase
VRGYKEKGNINTPMELAIQNQIDRFNLVIDVVDRVPKLGSSAAYVRERMKNEIIENINYAHEHGKDKPEIADWHWSL